jgi:hypothetical protein
MSCTSIFSAAIVAAVLLTPFAAGAQVAARPYVLVLGPDNPQEREVQAPMCRQVLKSLNELNYEPPMTCRRSFDPTYTFLAVPEWKALNDTEALEVALAWERNLAGRGPPSQIETRFATNSSRVKRISQAGELKAWQATLDLVKNAESPRVVLLNYGQHKYEGQCFYETKLGVLLPDRFEVDKRYSNLSIGGGEIILHKQTAYIAEWSNVPSATLFNRVGPRGGKHKAYLLIQSMYWLKAGQGGTVEGAAGVYDTVCQIGYNGVGPAQMREAQ